MTKSQAYAGLLSVPVLLRAGYDASAFLIGSALGLQLSGQYSFFNLEGVSSIAWIPFALLLPITGFALFWRLGLYNKTYDRNLQARLQRTAELFREGWFPEIIVSGGVGKEGFDEAVVMRDWLAAHGVPAERIILDSHGDTTFASAKNTERIAAERKFKSVFVVSQYFHIARSRLALQRCGVTELRSAHAHFSEWRDLYSCARETVGYASYLLRRGD